MTPIQSLIACERPTWSEHLNQVLRNLVLVHPYTPYAHSNPNGWGIMASIPKRKRMIISPNFLNTLLYSEKLN
jgi:hypothetical protein